MPQRFSDLPPSLRLACHFCIYSVKINLENRFVTIFIVFSFEIAFARGIFLPKYFSVLYCIDPCHIFHFDLQLLKSFTHYFLSLQRCVPKKCRMLRPPRNGDMVCDHNAFGNGDFVGTHCKFSCDAGKIIIHKTRCEQFFGTEI